MVRNDSGIPLSKPQRPPTEKKRPKPSFKEKVSNLLGRNKKPSEELGERIIHINNQDLNDQQKFLHNRVFTAKYTAISFLPKFLYEEFSKYANLFFLFISGIQVKE
jgi:phospholipid-transporting ATPase